MPVVALFSCRKDHDLFDALYRALSQNGGVQSFCRNELKSSCESPLFSLCHTSCVPHTYGITGVLVFDDGFKSGGSFELSETLIPVLDSDNKKALSRLKEAGRVAITCGTGSRDTLSIASISESRATVSLQRELIDIYGNRVEPRDIIVTFENRMEVYPLLATCAALLLCGAEPDGGYAL